MHPDTYRPSFISGTKAKVQEQLWTKYPEQRVTLDRHSLKVVIIQTGMLGRFDLLTLLVTLTTSLGLLAVSTTIVDLLAIRVLPMRAAYRSAKYLVSPNL